MALIAPFGSKTRLSAEVGAVCGALADELGDMISVHGPDGTYRYVSAVARDILGYAPEDLVGTSAYDHFHPDDARKIAIAHRSALAGAPVTVAYRLRRRDHEYVWVETSVRTVSDETGEVTEILCSTRPVADRGMIESLSGDEGREALTRVQEVLENQEIGPVYQPIFELETERVIAFEALARFPGDPARGPDRWFEEAWQVGMGVPLELLAVQEAARALPELPDDVGLCVNASPPTISSDAFLKTFNGEADRITVELTEHLRVEDYRALTSKLGPLRRIGGKIAIDDFGAGYASLRHILKVSPEWIKLDISLTESVDENPVVHALATSLMSFAHEVGVQVIAEGIETEDELDALREIGFRYGQGFYFGLPAPIDEALASVS